MRREIPLLITILFGWVMLMEFFVAPLGPIGQRLRDWALIIIAVAQVLGVANVARISLEKISRRQRDWGYSVILLLGLFVMLLLGVVMTIPAVKDIHILGFRAGGIEDGTLFNQIYEKLYVPLQSTMFALLAFFIASAAYRAFKIRTVEATILALTAVIVMIGQVPVGQVFWKGMPGLTDWIMNVPNLAAKRAILIGAALGAIATGMKVILGLERNYIGE